VLSAAGKKSLHCIYGPRGWAVFDRRNLGTTTQHSHTSVVPQNHNQPNPALCRNQRGHWTVACTNHLARPGTPLPEFTRTPRLMASERNSTSRRKRPMTEKFTERVFCNAILDQSQEQRLKWKHNTLPSPFTSPPQPPELTRPCAFDSRHATPYLVSWKQQRQPRPQARRVQNQRGAEMGCQPVLADPRNVVRVWLLFQPALHHVPSQHPLTTGEQLRARQGSSDCGDQTDIRGKATPFFHLQPATSAGLPPGSHESHRSISRYYGRHCRSPLRRLSSLTWKQTSPQSARTRPFMGRLSQPFRQK